jgi:hypothetical protein
MPLHRADDLLFPESRFPDGGHIQGVDVECVTDAPVPRVAGSGKRHAPRLSSVIISAAAASLSAPVSCEPVASIFKTLSRARRPCRRQAIPVRDFQPVVKLFMPDADRTWLLTEIDPDNPDIAFGLCDLPSIGQPPMPLDTCNFSRQ